MQQKKEKEVKGEEYNKDYKPQRSKVGCCCSDSSNCTCAAQSKLQNASHCAKVGLLTTSSQLLPAYRGHIA